MGKTTSIDGIVHNVNGLISIGSRGDKWLGWGGSRWPLLHLSRT